MKKIKLHRVDSFTTFLFQGNPTAVVFDAHTLTEYEMKGIAREMNCPETAFIFPSEKADFRLRYFTPAGSEIKFCGHATIGALQAVSTELKEARPYQFQVETNAGILPMEIDLTNREDPIFKFDAPHIDLVHSQYTFKDLSEAFGVPVSLMDETKPIMLEKTNNYLYVAVPSLKDLEQFNIDMRKTTEFAKRDQIVVFCVLTTEAYNPANHVHARGFAPLVGVPEDPFTGSMQGGLAAYLLANGMIDPEVKRIGSEQGYFIDRPGEVEIEITSRDPVKARLHARATPVYTTELVLP